MYSVDYIEGKFAQAVYALVTGRGDAKSRVGEAYYRINHILIEDYPAEVIAKRKEIDKLLTTKAAPEAGYLIPYNLQTMRNKRASEIAELIYDIYLVLQKQKKAST